MKTDRYVLDKISGRIINVGALLAMAAAAEKRPDYRVDMGSYVSPCGTTACLVGTYLIDVCGRGYTFCKHRYAISHCSEIVDLGLSDSMYDFLFVDTAGLPNTIVSDRAMELTKEEAIKRLRKYIYWVLHRSEVLADYDEARKVGHADVVKKVKETVGV